MEIENLYLTDSGFYFWVEIMVGDSPGWWFTNNNFKFYNNDRSQYIIIKNSNAYINNKILTGEPFIYNNNNTIIHEMKIYLNELDSSVYKRYARREKKWN
jgi:hypothetical protein